MNKINLTFSQCKQVSANTDLGNFVERINDQPDWMQGVMCIDSIAELKAIIEGGCASNAHRSCYYSAANGVMAEHGDDVLVYLEDSGIELDLNGKSWSELASYCLQSAIELWCYQFESDLEGVDWD